MVIAIDHDGTFDRAPALWAGFVQAARERGHTCLILTGRSDVGEMGAEVRRNLRGVGLNLPVVFAGAKPKRQAAKAAGYAVDVFIDDMPEYVGDMAAIIGRSMCPGMLQAMRVLDELFRQTEGAAAFEALAPAKRGEWYDALRAAWEQSRRPDDGQA